MTVDRAGDPASQAPMTPFYMDGHVHCHGCFDRDAFLDGAMENLSRAAATRATGTAFEGCLWFAETSTDDRFGAFAAEAGRPGEARWRFEGTREEEALIARREDGARIWIVAGRQVETPEGLEVLALGTRRRFPRDLTLEEALDQALDSGAIAVVPWGFGKWWFGRGRQVRGLLERRTAGTLFLGDNAGRPQAAREPRLFRLGRERGFLVLPGSDPLPFPEQQARAGRYGFVAHGTVDPARPASSLKRVVRSLSRQPIPFGRREDPLGFIRNQVRMQVRKRIPRGPA